jgi:hypothetical protein
MHAHTPPFTQPTGAYDSRKLYDETSAIAAAQDAQLDPVIDVESRVRTAMQYLYHAQLLLKEACPARARSDAGLPAESAYLASFSPNGSRIATPAKIDGLRDVLSAEELKGFGIGDVVPRHPMHAEVLRDHDERLSGPEDHL